MVSKIIVKFGNKIYFFALQKSESHLQENIVSIYTIMIPIKKTIISFLIMILPIISTAQKTEIMGRVVDSINKKGIPYVSIKLTDSAGNMQNGTMTDTTGFFKLSRMQKNTYVIEISCIGYKTKIVPINANESQVYHKISLVTDTKLLDAAVITGDRITMREEIDKMVYKIDDFTLQNSTTALEALDKIPTVTVKKTDETIKVNGSSNVLVLVDGAYTTRSLSSITPEDIERIEVISNPSVEYDSDVANVINIVLKEERKKGLRIIAVGRATIPDMYDFARLSANFEFSKLRVFADYIFDRFVIRPESYLYDSTYYMTIDGGETHETYSSIGFLKSPPHFEHKIRYGLDYRISKNDLLKFTGNFSMDKAKGATQTFSRYEINKDTIFNQQDDGTYGSETPEQNYTLYYRHKFNEKGHEISLNTNLYLMKRNSWDKANSTFEYPDGDIQRNRMSKIRDNRQTTLNAKLKYDLPITEKLKMSIGTQSFYRKLRYDYDDSLKKQYFDYNDLRIAGFAQVSYNINKNFSVMAGLRCENLKFNIYDTLSRSQLNWLPSASALYKINDNHSLKLNYKTLLTYPSYHFLTPFVYVGTDSLVYSAGNPELLPSKTQKLSLQYSYRKSMTNIIMGPYVSFENGIIGELRQIDGLITNVGYGNVANSRKVGGIFGFTMLVGGFLVPMFDIDFGYAMFDDKGFNGWEFRVDAGVEMELPWDLTLEAYLCYEGTRRLYNGYTYSSPSLDEITISKDFDNYLTVSISVEDILACKEKEVHSGFNYYDKNWYETRFPTVSLFVRYVFNAGNKKIKDSEQFESLMESEKNVENRK